MNAAFLLIPIVVARYGLMPFLGKKANKRASFFPPLKDNEKMAYWVYQITTMLLLITLFFFEIRFKSLLNFIGLVIYALGFIYYIVSIGQFAKPNQQGLNIKGVYRYSRNPMYVSFFLFFLGITLIIEFWLYLVILLVFQISVHYLILSEERWCMETFGEDYKKYIQHVRRYI